MSALIFDGTSLRLKCDVPRPEPAGDECLIKVLVAGICSTDIEMIKGYMDFKGVPGHEFVGRIEAGPDEKLIGRRVVGDINCPCGTCEYCTDGPGYHCPSRTVLGIHRRNGAFAEYLLLPVANVYPVPDDLPDEEAVFAEPLAAAFQITTQIEFKPDQSVAVIGDGRLGLLVAQVIHHTEADVTLIGKHAAKLALAKRWGIQTFTAGKCDPPKGFDVVVECSGRAEGLDLAMRLVRPRGQIVLKSTTADSAGPNLAPLVINEVNLIGSRCGPIPLALRALVHGQIDVHSLITDHLPLEKGLDAINLARQSESLKVLLDVASPTEMPPHAAS